MQVTLSTSSVVLLIAAWGLHLGAYGQSSQTVSLLSAQQNALVKKYCAVCHTDTHLNGGLSLEHFDAAAPDPGVAARFISKLTSGLTPAQVSASRQQDPSVAKLTDAKMNTGAMGAAGGPAQVRGT
jgi:hypothetical protein